MAGSFEALMYRIADGSWSRRSFNKIGTGALLLYLTSGCIGKDTAVKGAETLYQQGAITDPHVEKATFGGYDINGDVEGNVGNYRFKVEQKDMHIGDGADAVGIILSDGKGGLYMREEFARGAFVKINKGGSTEEQWNLIRGNPVLDARGLVGEKLDLEGLVEKYGLSGGDFILIADMAAEPPRPFVKYIVQ